MLPLGKDVPVVYLRGGTSKALFFHEHDLPTEGPLRDMLLKRVMGSPDPMQIDGMGGSHLVTSKIAIIKPSEREDADVDYTFAQVSIGGDDINYAGNCGNISSAAGPFALDEGLVKEPKEGSSIDPNIKTVQVRIYNTGTKKRLVSHVPVDKTSGLSVEEGNFSIAGVPGTGAPILLDFKDVADAKAGHRILPLGTVVSHTNVGGICVPFTLCEAGNLFAFALAQDLGFRGDEKPADLDSNAKAISTVKELRGKVAQLAGMCQDWTKVDEQSPMAPMVVLVSEPTDAEANIQVRLFLDNKCHTSMAGTGGIATAASSRITGSIVNKVMKTRAADENILTIQHPLGLMPVLVEVSSAPTSSEGIPEFTSLSMIRTARRILDGKLRVPWDMKAAA